MTIWRKNSSNRGNVILFFWKWLLSSSAFMAYLLLWFYWSAKNYSSNGEIELFLQFNRNLHFWIFEVAADKIIQSLAMQEEIEKKKPFSRKFWILMRGKNLWFHVKLNWTTIKMFGLTSLTVQIIICQPHVLEKLHLHRF